VLCGLNVRCCWSPIASRAPALCLLGSDNQRSRCMGSNIRGFEVHGVHLACVDGFLITGNIAHANAFYGLAGAGGK
jgi:hypothetical protein